MTQMKTRKLFAFLLTLALVFSQFTILTVFAAEEAVSSDPVERAQAYLSKFDDDSMLTHSKLDAIVAILNGEEPAMFRAFSEDPIMSQSDFVKTMLLSVAGMKESQFGGAAPNAAFNYNEMAKSAGFFTDWNYEPEAMLEIIDASDMLDALNPHINALKTALTKNEPYFVNGMAVPIFPYGNSIYNDTSGEGVARFCVYVETDLDTDGDGKLDLVKAFVQLPRAAVNNGMKVATIYEARPYTEAGGTGQGQSVDTNHRARGDKYLQENPEFSHEDLYATPPARTPVGKTTTKAMVENANYNDWYYRYSGNSVSASITYTGTMNAYEDRNWYDYYLTRGFAVVESAGIGNAGGEGFANCGADIEINAFRCVIEWLAGNRTAYSDRTGNIAIEADWSNGSVGMTGRSYAGTTQFGLSTTGVEGLKTIVPVAGIASWYEYTNGQGRLGSTAYSTGLAWLVNSRLASWTTEAGTTSATSTNWDAIPLFMRYMGYSQLMRLEETALNGDYGPHWARRDYTVENWFRDWGPSKIKTPMLIVHGVNDDNVRAKQSVLMYQAAKKADVPVKMMWHQGHHMTPTYPASTYEMYCGTYNINGEEVDLMYDDILNLWFSHWLYDVDNDVEDILPNVITQSNDIVPEGNGSNGWVYYDSWESEQQIVMEDINRVTTAAPSANARIFGSMFAEPEDYSEEYPIPDANPEGSEEEGNTETEIINIASASEAVSSGDNLTLINSANGSSSWQNFLTAPTAGSSLYVVELPEDYTVKGVVEVNVRAAFATLGGSTANENLSMHVKLVEIAAPGTTLNYYGGAAVGSTIGTTTLLNRGAWMGGGVDNYNLVRFTQTTTGNYREIAKGWIDLCNPEAKYDSYTASREGRIVPSENIGVFHDYTVFMQPAIHTAKAGNKLALIITTGNTSAAAYTGNNAFTFNIDNDATNAIIPIADEEVSINELKLTSGSRLAVAGEPYEISTQFTNPVNSNAAILTYEFDPDRFEYVRFDPATGIKVLDEVVSGGQVKITIMKQNYGIKEIGNIVLRAKVTGNVGGSNGTVSVTANYAVKTSEGKEIWTDKATLTFPTVELPEFFTLIDLSNIIDCFGFDRTHENWDAIYVYYDFNSNGQIDTFDICYVAQKVK